MNVHVETPAREVEVNQPVFLGVGSTARMFGLSPDSIMRMVSRGEFPAPVRLGRATRWPMRALEVFADTAAVESLGQVNSV